MKHAWSEKKKKENNNGNNYEEALGYMTRVELFLGKRRYFSGIAALTPLTPSTYKQNAVNAFIPTKKRR